MAIDPNIALNVKPLQIQDPLESVGKAFALKNMLNQGRLQEAELEQMPLRNKLAMMKAETDAKRAGIDFDNAQLDKIGKASGILGNFAASIRATGYSQEAWDQGKSFLQANGAPPELLAGLPAQVDRTVVDGLAMRSLSVKDAIERGDYAALGEEAPQAPKQSVDQISGAVINPISFEQPEGTPIAENEAPPVHVTAQAPVESPDDLRAAARKLETKRPLTEAAITRADQLRKQAKDLEDTIFRQQDQWQPVAGAPGVTFNKLKNQYLIDDKPASAKEVQLIADRNRKAGATSVNVNTNETPGRKKVDEKFAEEFVEFEAAGGYADVVKQLQQLREVSKQLETKNLTGPIIGNTPDFVKQFTNPESIAAREQVQEVAQRNLRVVLGPQFTAKEGEALIERVYNPKLSEAENLKRVNRLTAQIEVAAKAKQEAADYFRKYGTLTGWEGKKYTLSDFDDAIEGKNDPLGIR